MANHTPRASARLQDSHITAHQAAVTTIGALLVAYRINGRAEQRAELLGMAKMAVALGAIDADTHACLLNLIIPNDIPATPHASGTRMTRAIPAGRHMAGLEVRA